MVNGIGALLVLMLIVGGLIGVCAGWATGRAYGRAEGASWQRWQATRRPPVTAEASVTPACAGPSSTGVTGNASGLAGGRGLIHAEMVVLTQGPPPAVSAAHPRVVPGLVVEPDRKELER